MSGSVRRMAGRDTGLSSNVVEADASCHSLGEAGGKGADLRMDVSKKVSPVHRPIFIISELATPWSFRAIAPDARKEWVPIRWRW
jgi:hypothetical protein